MTGHPDVEVVWDPRFTQYDFGEAHPFREAYRGLAVDLLESLDLFSVRRKGVRRVREVSEASREELETFHTPKYLDKVRDHASRPEPGFLDRGDTPAFPRCFEASARIVAGTLRGLRDVLAGEAAHAVNFAGGLHHSAPGRASGFCIFNDIGVAIHEVLRQGGKVAYIDVDAHHGDGVMYGFYADGKVLDIDFHQDGRTLFPGTGMIPETGAEDGQGLKVNVPLPPGCGDEALIPLFERLVPPMLREYRPDLIILQGGADAHAGDPLAHLQYTPKGYRTVVESLHQLSHELSGGRFLVLGGGGYHPANVSRTFAQHAILTAGRADILDTAALPTAWQERYREVAQRPAPKTWDEISPTQRSPWTKEKEEHLLAALSQALGRKL